MEYFEILGTPRQTSHMTAQLQSQTTEAHSSAFPLSNEMTWATDMISWGGKYWQCGTVVKNAATSVHLKLWLIKSLFYVGTVMTILVFIICCSWFLKLPSAAGIVMICCCCLLTIWPSAERAWSLFWWNLLLWHEAKVADNSKGLAILTNVTDKWSGEPQTGIHLMRLNQCEAA